MSWNGIHTFHSIIHPRPAIQSACHHEDIGDLAPQRLIAGCHHHVVNTKDQKDADENIGMRPSAVSRYPSGEVSRSEGNEQAIDDAANHKRHAGFDRSHFLITHGKHCASHIEKKEQHDRYVDEKKTGDDGCY